MAVRTKYYYGAPEAWDIQDAELANVTIEQVTRSGLVYVVSTSAITHSQEVLYTASSGNISWGEDNPFPYSADKPSILAYEKLSVKFKY